MTWCGGVWGCVGVPKLVLCWLESVCLDGELMVGEGFVLTLGLWGRMTIFGELSILLLNWSLSDKFIGSVSWWMFVLAGSPVDVEVWVWVSDWWTRGILVYFVGLNFFMILMLTTFSVLLHNAPHARRACFRGGNFVIARAVKYSMIFAASSLFYLEYVL